MLRINVFAFSIMCGAPSKPSAWCNFQVHQPFEQPNHFHILSLRMKMVDFLDLLVGKQPPTFH